MEQEQEQEHNILIVDSDSTHLNSLWIALNNENYNIYTTTEANECFNILNHFPISLIITEHSLQGMSGLDLLRKVMELSPQTIRMIYNKLPSKPLLSGLSDYNLIYQSLHLPWCEDEIKLTIRRSLERYDLEYKNKQLSCQVKRSNVPEIMTEELQPSVEDQEKLDQVQRIHGATIFSLAKLTEYREPMTGEHLLRTKTYVKVLTHQLKKKDRYKDYITDQYAFSLEQASILHDIGKICVPDGILLKPGRLSIPEFEIIKKHTITGGETLESAEHMVKDIFPGIPFLALGKLIAFYHHERWDGTGYPQKLQGEDIPLCARIVAVADVYDALTSDRPYRAALSHEDASSVIMEEKENHFDPEIVNEFEQVRNIFKSYSDCSAKKNRPINASIRSRLNYC